MITKIQTKLYFLSLSIFIIFMDQFTKYLVFYNYKKFLNKDFLLFRLDFVKNYGAAFNIFSGSRVFLSCLLYTSPSPRDRTRSRMPSSA